MAAQLKMAKQSVNLGDPSPSEAWRENNPYLLNKLISSLAINSQTTKLGDAIKRGSTYDVQFNASLNFKDGGSASTGSSVFHWRRSLASSAHRVSVNYVPNMGAASTKFKYGTYKDSYTMAKALSAYFTGSRDVAASYSRMNSVETTKAMIHLIDNQNSVLDQDVCTFKIWHQVWHARAAISILESGVQAVWMARPIEAQSARTGSYIINEYEEIGAYVYAGLTFLVELYDDELAYIPMLTFLLGFRNSTMQFAMGKDNGVRRVPHLLEKTPIPFDYRFMCVNGRNDWNADHPYVQPALPGLAAGMATANQQVGQFQHGTVQDALRIIARNAPIVEDIHSAAMLVIMELFADYHSGVQIPAAPATNNIGQDNEHSAYGLMMHNGFVSVPDGSLVTCLFTQTTANSAGTQTAQAEVATINRLFRSLVELEAAHATIGAALQLTARAAGMTLPAIFPSVPVAGWFQAGIAVPAYAQAKYETHYSRMNSAGRDETTEFMGLFEITLKTFYEVKAPLGFLTIPYGNRKTNAGGPYVASYGRANIGECMSTVHPSTVPSMMWVEVLEHWAGVPLNLEELVAEMEFRINVDETVTVAGKSESLMESGQGYWEYTLMNGVDMLGHAIILRRGQDPAAGARWLVTCVPPREAGVGVSFDSVRVEMTTCMHQSFCLSNAFSENPAMKLRINELYADHDYGFAADLYLTMPAAMPGDTLAGSQMLRRLWPGYVMLSLRTAQINEIKSGWGRIIYPASRKRNAPTPAAQDGQN
jgi:hypothetical protein